AALKRGARPPVGCGPERGAVTGESARAFKIAAVGIVVLVVPSADFPEQHAALDATLRNIEGVLDLDRMRKEKADLEEQASAPDLWDDPSKAQVVTSRLSNVQSEINRVERLRARLEDVAGVSWPAQ